MTYNNNTYYIDFYTYNALYFDVYNGKIQLNAKFT